MKKEAISAWVARRFEAIITAKRMGFSVPAEAVSELENYKVSGLMTKDEIKQFAKLMK